MPRLHGKLVNKHGKLVNKHGKLVNKHGKLVNKHGKLVNKHGKLVNKHGWEENVWIYPSSTKIIELFDPSCSEKDSTSLTSKAFEADTVTVSEQLTCHVQDL
jgi:hypothetical protein